MGIFYRLTELSLSNGNDEHSPDIFTLLKNTPALNRLELENYAISWLQFESLHKNVAQLSVLLLNSVKTPQQPYRNAVEPNSILKTLTIRHCTLGYDEQFHWIRYIVQKYSDLEHFTFFVLPVPDQRRVEIDEYHERLIMPLVDGLGTQLKTFVLKHGLFTHKLFQALDSKEYRLNKLGLYSLVTPEADQGLFQSHQATYLRELSLFRADFKSFKQFKVFKHLKSLKLSFGEDRNQVIQDHSMVSIALNEMLSELPKQLEELVLVSCAVRIEPFVSSLPSQIRSLTFDNTELDSQVSTFISDYCRRLHTLSLILCQPGLSTILLPDHRLSCFEIFSHDTQPIFMLTIGDQHHYYNMNRVLFRGLKGIKRYFGVQDTPAFATRTADQDPINSTRPIIHLTCRSLSALYINTRLAI
ncbi:hypothetical protein K501DRAFT_281560 [Backusella circina FSU 941]|nr:hypothetical protein K501DRAFT_281560 [Backusella circina FSU 941]